MQPFKWLRERSERRAEATALALLRQIEREGVEYIFNTGRSSWESMAIQRGWIEPLPDFVPVDPRNPVPYRLSIAGRDALLRAGE